VLNLEVSRRHHGKKYKIVDNDLRSVHINETDTLVHSKKRREIRVRIICLMVMTVVTGIC